MKATEWLAFPLRYIGAGVFRGCSDIPFLTLFAAFAWVARAPSGRPPSTFSSSPFPSPGRAGFHPRRGPSDASGGISPVFQKNHRGLWRAALSKAKAPPTTRNIA
jgi:hypothetical protein